MRNCGMSLSERRWSDDSGPLAFSFRCCHLEAEATYWTVCYPCWRHVRLGVKMMQVSWTVPWMALACRSRAWVVFGSL